MYEFARLVCAGTEGGVGGEDRYMLPGGPLERLPRLGREPSPRLREELLVLLADYGGVHIDGALHPIYVGQPGEPAAQIVGLVYVL